MENASYVSMQEDFELVELSFPEGPCLSAPEQEVHGDGLEEQVFVEHVQVGILPYFLQCSHRRRGSRNSSCDILIVPKAEVDEGSEIAKGACEADISVGDREVCCFGKFVVGVVVSLSLILTFRGRCDLRGQG